MVQRISKQLGGTGVDNTGTLHVDSANNRLGIGTSSFLSTEKLNIYENGSLFTVHQSEGSGYARQYFHNTTGYTGSVGHDSSGNFGLSYGNLSTNNLTIDSSGNVGIGTASPATNLNVLGAGTNLSGSIDYLAQFQSTDAGGFGIRIGQDGTNGMISGIGTSGLSFVTYNGSSWGERVLIDSSGNVGIGDTNPLAPIDLGSSIGPRIILYDVTGVATTADYAIGIQSSELRIAGDANTTFYTGGYSGTERMRIDSSGNVGIGNTNPSEKLEVTGNVAATSGYIKQENEILLPAGSMQMFAGASTPGGWLLCDGSAVSRTTYADLFAAIGTTWGVGDGSTTFNVPDMRNVMPVGANLLTLGTVTSNVDASSQTATNSSGSHSHTAATGAAGGHDHTNVTTTVAASAKDSSTTSVLTDVLAVGNHTHSISADGSHTHTVTHPSAAVNFIIKT